MSKSVHILIVGGGITGLALANLLVHGNKKINFRVSLFEWRPKDYPTTQGIGGGIGLWSPSQEVLKNLTNYSSAMEHNGFTMPLPSYRNSNGRVLAKTNKKFNDRFPVQCLDRTDLINMLMSGLINRNDIEIINSQKISSYEREEEQIILKSETNKVYKGDLLIVCDGIHSKLRNCLMSELQLPPVFATELGYTYFRANTLIPANSMNKWWSTTFETWGAGKSKKYGEHAVRFGYVPLKSPSVFWFIAIKTQKNHKFLSPIRGIKVIDEETKEFLLELVCSWQAIHTDSGDIAVNYEELIRLTTKILRTDIAKIQNVEKFPWTSQDKRVVLMGDAAHATAPNIAQGAGLCIEDAACFASKVNRVDYLHGIFEYELDRKSRAKKVQGVADFIAAAGQVDNSLFRILRNGIMRLGARLTPSLQQGVFEYLVSYSLGGSRKLLYWQVPPLSITDDASASLFARVFPDIGLLEPHIQEFKASGTGGSGLGAITVEKPLFFAKFLEFFFSFPKNMDNQPFYAEVINVSENEQRWIRVFGDKTTLQKTYTTTHSSYCGLNRKVYLSEGLGGVWDRAIRFIYTVTLQPDKSVKYESQGIIFYSMFKIPLPQFLLPKSSWIEKPTSEGWVFEGQIRFSILGTLLHYYGNFHRNKIDCVANKRIIIAGGSGMIGQEVCITFIRKGYDVYCLSRSRNTRINIDGVKVRLINEDWSDLIDKNTIILNLSGANPGAQRWTSSVKATIAESRYQVIETIVDNIKRAAEKPLKYLQASAAGFYGDAGDILLTESSVPVFNKESGTKFRVEVCKELEQRATKANCNVVNLRLGHVFSRKSSLWRYLKLCGLINIGKLGSGKQFVPLVHISDVAKAIEFIAQSEITMEGAINIVAPHPARNQDLLKELRWIKWGSGFSIPKFALNLLIGQSSVVLTDSERVYPHRLLNIGFRFDYKNLQEVLNGLK